jgi:hypothetical protein
MFMRKAVFNIYKALRHFGVTAEEVGKIANGYKIWINNPVEDVRDKYRIVYYCDGVLYAMPLLIDALKDKFVGIEINNVVYFAFHKCTHKSLISATLEMPWYFISDLKLSDDDWKGISKIKVELPTKEEIISMVKTVNGRACDAMHSGRHLYDEVSHVCPGWWVIVEHDENLENTDIYSVNGNGYPFDDETSFSYVQPVTHLREGIDFAGKVNYFGVPDKKTIEMYKKLITTM